MPIASYNGCYNTVGEHDGWRRFENEAGKHLFRYVPDQEWHLHAGFYPTPPEEGQPSRFPQAYIEAPDGSLPAGEVEWNVAVDGKWCDTTLTVA